MCYLKVWNYTVAANYEKISGKNLNMGKSELNSCLN